MFEELNNELIEIKEKLRERQKLQGDIDKTRSMLSEKMSQLRELRLILEKEHADVKKLEGLSLNGLFHFILGDKDRQLNKERQEYLYAQLKYDECKHAVSALEKEIEGLKSRIAAIGELDTRYEDVVRKKEQLLTQNCGESTRKLSEISEAIADKQSDMKELNEAIAAGRLALKGLNQVVSSLRSAHNWGTFDLLGGGLISTAVKHSRINSARESIHRVQQQLRIFQRELADVGSKTDIEIDIGSFATFADYVFDGLIVDWIVQSRINKSLDAAVRVSNNVQNVLMRLQNSCKDTQSKRNTLEQEKRKLIEQA